MKTLESLRWFVRLVCTALGIVGALAIVFIQVLVTLDVILRNSLNRPIIGSFELVEYGMVVAVCCAFGITQLNHFHISVDVIVSRLPRRGRAVLDAVTLFIMLLFFATAAWIGYDQTAKMMARGAYSQVLLIPRWPFQATVVAGFASLLLAIFLDFVLAVAKVFGRVVDAGESPREEMRSA